MSATSPDSVPAARPVIKEILPKQGLVYSEKNTLTELLCKPKIMPIKSLTLQKLEQMQKDANAVATGASQHDHTDSNINEQL